LFVFELLDPSQDYATESFRVHDFEACVLFQNLLKQDNVVLRIRSVLVDVVGVSKFLVKDVHSTIDFI
jgi:hypothetical protein